MPQKMVLSDQALKKLIKEVRKRECLWNPQNERYNDRYQMAKCWMEVAECMQLPEERLRVKWKNLRDLFKKEIKKFGSGDRYTGKWRHFENLRFLSKIPENGGKGTNNANKINTKEEIDDVEEFEFEVTDQDPDDHRDEVYLEETFQEDPIPEKIEKLSTEDYDVMFLKSLAPYFRQLDPIRKLVVRSKMQDMLLNEIAAQTTSSQFKKS